MPAGFRREAQVLIIDTEAGPPGPNRKIASGFCCSTRSKNGAKSVVASGMRTEFR